ncbi:clumping factor A-like [Sitodiplosis mosellana]|uniref:clumping factor A-like n=1 Tax=Sitodiplosis mosellana TaxID=263140 RepID=UPI0024438D83|nr:clumping factor A-like [Sitodiplosis mosellana]
MNQWLPEKQASFRRIVRVTGTFTEFLSQLGDQNSHDFLIQRDNYYNQYFGGVPPTLPEHIIGNYEAELEREVEYEAITRQQDRSYFARIEGVYREIVRDLNEEFETGSFDYNSPATSVVAKQQNTFNQTRKGSDTTAQIGGYQQTNCNQHESTYNAQNFPQKYYYSLPEKNYISVQETSQIADPEWAQFVPDDSVSVSNAISLSVHFSDNNFFAPAALPSGASFSNEENRETQNYGGESHTNNEESDNDNGSNHDGDSDDGDQNESESASDSESDDAAESANSSDDASSGGDSDSDSDSDDDVTENIFNGQNISRKNGDTGNETEENCLVTPSFLDLLRYKSSTKQKTPEEIQEEKELEEYTASLIKERKEK